MKEMYTLCVGNIKPIIVMLNNRPCKNDVILHDGIAYKVIKFFHYSINQEHEFAGWEGIIVEVIRSFNMAVNLNGEIYNQ